MRTDTRGLSLAAGLILVLTLVLTPAESIQPAQAQAALPPLPAGWPNTLQLGMNDSPGGAGSMRATAPFGYRYLYLSGGVNNNPEHGWATWNPNGTFASNFMKESIDNGITPVFTYYQIRGSGPNSGQNDGDADFNNLQNQ